MAYNENKRNQKNASENSYFLKNNNATEIMKNMEATSNGDVTIQTNFSSINEEVSARGSVELP